MRVRMCMLCVCMYTSVYTCTLARVSVCMYVPVHLCIYIYMYMYMPRYAITSRMRSDIFFAAHEFGKRGDDSDND